MIPLLTAAEALTDGIPIPVRSSAIASAGYDASSSTLTIEFKDSGQTYAYHGVPAAMFAALLTAPSKADLCRDT